VRHIGSRQGSLQGIERATQLLRILLIANICNGIGKGQGVGQRFEQYVAMATACTRNIVLHLIAEYLHLGDKSAFEVSLQRQETLYAL
jgi:hypothetical protein